MTWVLLSFLRSGLVSSATELRCALFAEGRQTLFEVFCATGQLEVEEFLVHRLGQRRVLTVVDGLFGEPDRHGGPRGKPCQQFGDDVVEFGTVHTSVDQTPVRRVDSTDL